MTKTIFKTLLSLLILFSISCGDRPTGSGGTIGDNKETPQTETPASKEFLNNTINKVVSYTGEIVEIKENDNANSYSFDANADITSVTGNGGGGMPNQTYKFWGMAPDNNQIAYYYYMEQNSGGQSYYYPYYYALKYENGNIAEESANHNSDLYKKMQAAMLEVDTSGKTYYDRNKINPSQTTTKEAGDWKSQVAGKTMTGNYYSDNNASFVFDNNGNLKITYQAEEYDYMTGKPTGNKIPKTENVIFWGARNNGTFNTTLYGLYYIYSPYMSPSYNSMSFSVNGSSIQINYGDTEAEKLMHPIDTSTHYDNTKLKTPQNNTTEANNWKSQVAGKQFTSKYIITYNYTFELGGNIKETTGSGEYAHTETYYFWGALDSSRVVYYKKYNAREYFGDIYQGEDKEIWEYCGFEFDKNNLTVFKKYELSQAYRNSFYSWFQSQNENNINWSSLPLPKRSDIDWNTPTPKTGTLTTR